MPALDRLSLSTCPDEDEEPVGMLPSVGSVGGALTSQSLEVVSLASFSHGSNGGFNMGLSDIMKQEFYNRQDRDE